MKEENRLETPKYDLAIVIERYFEFGGFQRDMLRFARSCTKAGHNITVFTSVWDGVADDTVKVKFVDFRLLKSRMWEICKSGSVRGIEVPHIVEYCGTLDTERLE
jgi:hypothetical protein